MCSLASKMKLRSYELQQQCSCTSVSSVINWPHNEGSAVLFETLKDRQVQTSDGQIFEIHTPLLCNISDAIHQKFLEDISPSELSMTSSDFECVLNIAYTGSCEIDEQSLEGLLQAGSMYEI